MAKAKPKLTIKTVINGDEWTLHLWRDKAYDKLHGDDSAAITIPDDNLMEFKESELNKVTVAHELFHAYFKYLHLESTTTLDISDIEEVVASWLGNNYEKFSAQSNYLFNMLSGVKVTP